MQKTTGKKWTPLAVSERLGIIQGALLAQHEAACARNLRGALEANGVPERQIARAVATRSAAEHLRHGSVLNVARSSTSSLKRQLRGSRNNANFRNRQPHCADTGTSNWKQVRFEDECAPEPNNDCGIRLRQQQEAHTCFECGSSLEWCFCHYDGESYGDDDNFPGAPDEHSDGTGESVFVPLSVDYEGQYAPGIWFEKAHSVVEGLAPTRSSHSEVEKSACSQEPAIDVDAWRATFSAKRIQRHWKCYIARRNASRAPLHVAQCAAQLLPWVSPSSLQQEADNDELCLADDWVGSCVQLCGLVGKPEFNGLFGFIQEFDVHSGRLCVLVQGRKQLLKIKPANLYESSCPTWAQCSLCNVGDASPIASTCPYCREKAAARINSLKSIPSSRYGSTTDVFNRDF